MDCQSVSGWLWHFAYRVRDFTHAGMADSLPKGKNQESSLV
jgi:hypothetical protein